jgi:hypothetical protein
VNYRIDLFAIFIFLGIVQAIFLSYFFLTGENRKVQANLFQGILLLAIACNNIEIFVMYTGYIVNCLYLVDFSEPIAFAIGPSLYLLTRSRAQGQVGRKELLHFITPVVYFILLLPFFLTSDDYRYNAFMSAYHPEGPYRDTPSISDPRNGITNHPTEFILSSLFIYIILSGVEIVKAFKTKRESFWKTTNPILVLLRNEAIVIAALFVMIIIVKLLNRNDTGDHLFAACISLSVYLTSFRLIKNYPTSLINLKSPYINFLKQSMRD